MTTTNDGFGWVIERYYGPSLNYWTGNQRNPWTTDHLRALRFARQVDADCMLTWHCDGIGRVCEHGWASTQIDAPGHAARQGGKDAHGQA